MLTAVLSACGGTGSASKGVVNVYNWGEYISDGTDGTLDICEEFERQTGIKVNYQVFDSNESMYAMLASGGASYDVIIPSDYMISRMIEEDMLEQLNFDNIPNYSDIDPALKNPEYDPDGLYSVPYMWGTVGIIYNTSMITEPVEGWGSLFDPAYAGQILMLSLIHI